MSITSLLKSGLLESVTAVSLTDMFLAIALSFSIGVFIQYVYKKTFRGVLYSSGFGLSLVGMCMVSAILILAVSSNIVLSLGMVGALSIVRFRTAIKEPLDIVFLFWALSAGIILAAGMIPLAVFGSLAVGAMLLFFVNKDAAALPYILVITLTDCEREADVLALIGPATEKHVVKGKTIRKDGSEELTVEVRLKDGSSAFVKDLAKLAPVADVVMVAYNGDYMN